MTAGRGHSLQDKFGLKILGTGRSLPQRAVHSQQLDAIHAFEQGHVEALTGVSRRFFCEGESQIDLACAAAHDALESAGLVADDIDLIVSAAAVPYQPLPATAPAIQRVLGIKDGACFSLDINSACLGFPAALHFVEPLLCSRKYARALIVSSELASRGLPWKTQPGVAGLFGDGAGAAIVSVQTSVGIRAAKFVTLPSAYEACEIGAGGTRFDFEREPELFAAHSKFLMDGKELFRVTAKYFAKFVSSLLEDAETKVEEIDRVIAHQASPGALAHMVRLCGFETGQVIDISSLFGNQIAASIPFVLDYAFEHALVKPGNRIAILGTSAGVSFGGLVMDI